MWIGRKFSIRTNTTIVHSTQSNWKGEKYKNEINNQQFKENNKQANKQTNKPKFDQGNGWMEWETYRSIWGENSSFKIVCWLQWIYHHILVCLHPNNGYSCECESYLNNCLEIDNPIIVTVATHYRQFTTLYSFSPSIYSYWLCSAVNLFTENVMYLHYENCNQFSLIRSLVLVYALVWCNNSNVLQS